MPFFMRQFGSAGKKIYVLDGYNGETPIDGVMGMARRKRVREGARIRDVVLSISFLLLS